MVPSASYRYYWRAWVGACLICQSTSSNKSIHFCDFHRESVEYRMYCLTIVRKNVLLLNEHLRDSCLQCSVTLCYVNRSGSGHMHTLAKGLPSYILQTGSGRSDGRNVYRVNRRAQMTMSLVRGHHYSGGCRCSAPSALVPEGGVGLSFWTQNPKVG